MWKTYEQFSTEQKKVFIKHFSRSSEHVLTLNDFKELVETVGEKEVKEILNKVKTTN